MHSATADPNEHGRRIGATSPARRLLPAAAVLACVLTAACDRAPGTAPPVESPPNLVLITVDTLRADHLGAYGAERASTPKLDALAAEGIVFDAAYTQVPWTRPSMAVALTGLQPDETGVRSNADGLSSDLVTIGERLQAHGYQTAAVIGSYPLDSVFGLDQGFDSYDDEFTHAILQAADGSVPEVESRRFDRSDQQTAWSIKKLAANSRREDAAVTATALRTIDAFDAGRPFFLWVHYFGPHAVRDLRVSGDENDARHIRSYAQKVARTDAAVGAFLDGLQARGRSEGTLLILHSDHGESLDERDRMGHGRNFYEEALRIPFIVRWPNEIAPMRSAALVGNIDIAPTFADAAGIDQGAQRMTGKSLLPLIREAADGHAELYAETYMTSSASWHEWVELADGSRERIPTAKFALVEPPWKFVVIEANFDPDDAASEPARSYRRVELYHLQEDPLERTNRAASEPSRVAGFEAELASRRSTATEMLTPQEIAPTEEHLEKLRELGYVE